MFWTFGIRLMVAAIFVSGLVTQITPLEDQVGLPLESPASSGLDPDRTS